MIRLDARLGEKEQILELLGSAVDNRNYELECLFNNAKSGNKSYYNITHTAFMNILKRFKSNPEFEVKTNSRLAITFPNSSNMRGVRVLVKGVGAINSYCNSDSFASIINSVDFEVKTRPKTRLVNLEIPNYNIKFNLKEEVNFNNDTNRIRDIQREWSDVPKNYRYKKTFSFIKKTGDFQIDVSIVKASTNIDRFITVEDVIKNNLIRSVIKPAEAKGMGFGAWWSSIEKRPDEKVLVRNGDNFFKNIKESNVFNNPDKYEVEVEYIKNKAINKPRFKNIETKQAYLTAEFQGFFRYIGAVLQCIQGSNFILSAEEKSVIKRNFTKVVINSITEDLLQNNHSETDDTKAATVKRDASVKAKLKGQRGGYQVNEDGDIDFSNTTEPEMSQDAAKLVGTEVKEESELQGGGGGLDSDEHDEHDDHDDLFDDDKLDNEENGASDAEVIDSDETSKQVGGARKIAELRSRISDQFRNSIFFGPLIIDLSKNNATKLDPEALPDIATNTNIHINYLVTDKTDGERCLLFIDSKGAVYGVDRAKNIRSLGLTMPSVRDSILDGELVTRGEDGRVLNNFYIFDAYIYQGTCVMHRPFLFNKMEGRHHAILEVVKYFETGNNIIQSNPKLPLLIYKKDYLPGNSARVYSTLDETAQTQMQLNCENILNKMNKAYGGYLEVGHLFPYKTDGLVFLPNNMGVFQYKEGAPIASGHPFKEGRWNINYKWKPADLLTIDFRVEFVKDLGTGKMKYEYRGDQKYIRVELKSAVYQNRNDDNNALNFWLMNSGIKLHNVPESFPFFAVNPFVGHFDKDGKMQNNMSDALFRVDVNDNVFCDNGDILTDGQIVECGYAQAIKDEQMRWYPHRVRADKSSPNSYLVAEASWYLINNPITRDFLSGRTQPTPTTEDLADVTYYSDNRQLEPLTKALNDFHSDSKRYVITRALTGLIRPRVLDLAVGKFAELSKYLHAGVNTVVGIEIGYDGLNNPFNGACTRVMNWAKTNPAVAKLADRTMLIVGDATLNISTGECARDNLNRYYLDVLYGRAAGNTPKLKKLESIALEGFDCVTCMYAIHYMMNSEESLDGFLRNVSENLQDQGYFVGTCLDGMAILREMGRSTELSGVIGNKTVFKIKKLDTAPDAYKDITVGNKVMVYYEKFAGQFPENLVNMSYLREKAREHNLKLIEYRTFLEEPGNLLSQYESVNKKGAEKIRSEDALMTWAGFNAYFIFQKVRD